MKLFTCLLVASLCALGLVFADDTDGANQMVDQIIEGLKKNKNLDPFHIRDHRAMFDKKIGLIEVKGEIDLRQTVMTGLSGISRNGDAKLDSGSEGFTAKLRLGDNDVSVVSELTVRLGELIHPNLRLETEVGHLDVQLALGVGSDGAFQLKDFYIDELKKVHVKVHGLSILDPLIDIVANLFVKFFNKDARDMVSEMVRPMIEVEIKHLKPGN